MANKKGKHGQVDPQDETGLRYEPMDHIVPLEVAPRVDGVLDQREITVQTYQTTLTFDRKALETGLESAWLSPQIRLGVTAQRVGASEEEIRVVLGLQDDLPVRAYDYDARAPLWFAWKGLVVESVSIRYFRNDEGLLRFTTIGGGQRITEEKLLEFNSAFLKIPKDAVTRLQFDLPKLRDLCFNRFPENLYMIKFSNPSAIGYQSIDHALFKSRQYIDQHAERIEEVRKDPEVTIESFDSEVEIRSDVLALNATVRFEIRGLKGSLRLRFPKLTFKEQLKSIEEQSSVFYRLVDTAVMSILDADYYAKQRFSLDDLKLNFGMFPDLVDLLPFRQVLSSQNARAEFIRTLDVSAHWQDWLPHMRAIDELMLTDSIKEDVKSLVGDLAKRDPAHVTRVLAKCKPDAKLRRFGAAVAFALSNELQALPAEHRSGAEEALLFWSIEHETDAWDVDIESGEIVVGTLRWMTKDLSLDVLNAVIWKLVGVLHDRLRRGTDVSLDMSKYLWCTKLAQELPENVRGAPAAIRLLASRRVPCTPAEGRRVLRYPVATLGALDEAVLDQFGLPLWPCLRAERSNGALVLSNDGIGAAIAITMDGADLSSGVDLAPGQSISAPAPNGESISLSFEKYGAKVQAALPIRDGGATSTEGAMIKLRPAINRRRIEEQRKYREKIDEKGVVVGGSPALLRVFEGLHHANIIENGAAVLLLGEPGVGKTYVARLLHDSSSRCEKGYKEVNAGGSGGDLNIQKGEWVGYSKGHGISGIDSQGRPGHLTEVEGGTLFVDELAVFSHEMQVIFLSVLEKRGIQQVGGRTVTPNVRCVFATNADVDKAIEKGQLRRDLVDRISVKITIPPLRERRGDIVALAKHFIGNAGNFDDRCLLALLKYDWPGNVRELQIKIRRALARANMDGAASVKVEHLDIPRVVPSTSDADEDVRAQLWRLADQLARAEGFEQAAGLQHRSGEILRVGDAQASKMYANYGLAAASIG